MNRRTFLFQTSGLSLSIFCAPAFAQAPAKKVSDRIAMGTVLFRYRFKQTKPKEMAELKNELTLLDVPGYYRDRFGIRNLEFWSNHFESLEPAYIEKLKASIAAAGARLVNVQLDSSYDLASKKEEERTRSIAHVKEWMDAVSALGSTCVRVNPGRGGGLIEECIKSMREVNDYAKSKKLILLAENHFGIEMNPELHLRIVKEAGDDNIYTLPDFGNYPQETRFESLAKILPKAYFISAKASDFNADMEHVSFDFDKCVKLAEQLGFKGIYSVEQWSPKFQDIDYEKVGDWMIEHVQKNI
jgi:sugar phosphate isomerase/epimerase